MADEFYDHPDVRSAVRRVLYSKGIRNEHDLADGVQQVIANCIARDRKLGRTPEDVPQAKAWAITDANGDGIDAIRQRVRSAKRGYEGTTDKADDHAKERAAFVDPMVSEPLEEVADETLTPDDRERFVAVGSGTSQKELAKEAGVPHDVFRKQMQRKRDRFIAAMRRRGIPVTIGALMTLGAVVLGINYFRDHGDVTTSQKAYAEEQRHFAADKCKAREWDECEKALNRAQNEDPEGETGAEVKGMREAIAKGRGGAGAR
jgi:DNA-directed RNA polymerase specialized sigma24 family protein